jgi:hypothetical protein
LRLERLGQGRAGTRPADWLDRSRLAYLYLDQTPLTIPAAHRADIKRPDFLVAVDAVGTIAVDAKAKSFIDGCFVLDTSERRRLDGFESVFGIPVWYACFPPAEPGRCYLFRNRVLMGPPVMHDAAKQIIHAPSALGFAVEHAGISFAQALAQACGGISGLRPHNDLANMLNSLYVDEAIMRIVSSPLLDRPALNSRGFQKR